MFDKYHEKASGVSGVGKMGLNVNNKLEWSNGPRPTYKLSNIHSPVKLVHNGCPCPIEQNHFSY